MEKLTAIIPTYNEALHIESAIESVLFADEILIIDSYSTDETLELAKKFPVKIIQREYEYSASQKNWAIPQATHDWVFILDADERVTPALKDELLTKLQEPPTETSGYWIYRNNHFMDRKINFCGWQNDKVIRLFRRDACRYEDKMVHAEILTDGKVETLQNKLQHYSLTSFDEYIEKLDRYAKWQAKDYDAKTGKLNAYHFVLKPLWRFFKHYILQQGFRDGKPGYIICKLQAYAVRKRYYQLLILRKSN